MFAMKPATLIIFFLSWVLSLQVIFALPISQRRPRGTSPDLMLILRETSVDTANSKYTLLVVPSGTAIPVEEGSAAVSVSLLPAQGEQSNDQLTAAVHAIAGNVAKGDKAPFKDCFEFAVETARVLGELGYLNKEDAAMFKAYHDQHSVGKEKGKSMKKYGKWEDNGDSEEGQDEEEECECDNDSRLEERHSEVKNASITKRLRRAYAQI